MVIYNESGMIMFTRKEIVVILTVLWAISLHGAQVAYTPDTANFPNPERGYAPGIDPAWPSSATWDFCGTGNNYTAYNYTAWTAALDTNKLKQWRAEGMSMVMIRYHVAEFRSIPLSASFIVRLDADFESARRTGFKIVPRFVYNWPMGGPDASLGTILGHLGQLGDVYKRNVDVIAFVDLGFIGCWGEMHSSSNNLINGRNLNDATRVILDSAFKSLPPERMIAVRYPVAKFQYFNNGSLAPNTPLVLSEAYTRTTKARWGQHDDCLVCGEWNSGTWWTSRNNAAEIINFLVNDNDYVVQSGEPGDPGTNTESTDQDLDGYTLGQHESCARCVDIIKKEHWSTINASYSGNFNSAAYVKWKQEGCYYTIAKGLGYRYRLDNVTIADTLRTGSAVSVTIVMNNDGWARPYNPRRAEIVLRDVVQPSRVFRFAATSQDVRLWLPGPGEKKTLTASFTLPDSVPAGSYAVLLNLPDPHTRLNTNPMYSIRLANTGVWESAGGYNNLGATVRVVKGGGTRFIPRSEKAGRHAGMRVLYGLRGERIGDGSAGSVARGVTIMAGDAGAFLRVIRF